jgi:DNA-binding FadR family transcriptional regulator
VTLKPEQIAAARRTVEAAYAKLMANRWTASPEAVDRLKDVFRDARQRLERLTGKLWR